MAILQSVGKTDNKCERKVIEHLRQNLPEDFYVYHNLELPNEKGHPYEYDLIVFKNTIVWVVEVKDYRGTIRGNAVTWELLPNGNFKPNPIPLTNTKARILKGQIVDFVPGLKDGGFDIQVYVDSLIVLCDNRAKIRIRDPQKDRIVRLCGLVERLISQERLSPHSRYSSYIGLSIREMLDQWFKPLTPVSRIGDYEVLDSAFSHGNGSVTYLARSTLLKDQPQISLKVFRLDPYQAEEKLVKQQTLSLRAANALTLVGAHPHIVQCYSPFTWDADKVVIPLEWINGPTLRDLLNEGLSWSIRHRLDIFRQICEGMCHAHKHGVYHRTLSPENIVIVDDHHVKLVGFDFAKIVSSATRSTVGTQCIELADKRYLAPEAIGNPHIDSTKIDIFSAGAVLFEIMTGHSLFEEQAEKTRFASLPTLAAECPADSGEILLRMCAPTPQDRYDSFDEVLFDIQVIS